MAELCTRILSRKEGLKAIQEADIRAMRDGIESILNRGVALRISSEKAASWSIPIIIRESGCREKDGVPEAIEVMNHPFALAVQWHPEMMFDSEEQVKLLAAFVDAAKKF